MVRFCRRSGWLWDTQGPWCWSLSGGGGEVCGCGSMSAVPWELQLWSSASVPLPTRLPATCSSPRIHSGNPAQGQHTHPGSGSWQSGTLPTAHPPVTGILDVSACLFFSFWDGAPVFKISKQLVLLRIIRLMPFHFTSSWHYTRVSWFLFTS